MCFILPWTSGHHKAMDEQDSGLAIARYSSSATGGSMWKCLEIF